MGAQLCFGTAGATGGGFSAQSGSLQPSFGEFWALFNYSWQCRSMETRMDTLKWDSLWSFGCKMTGGGAVLGADGAAFIGDSMIQADWFNPPKIQDGCQSLKWLKGKCVDTTDAPLSGVNVTAVRASDQANVGYVVQSREDGSFDVPTPYVGVNHQVQAYLDGAPPREGGTLNTLVPTNIDGS